MTELLKTLKRLNLQQNITYKSYISKLAVENTKFSIAKDLKPDFDKFETIVSTHPIHCNINFFKERFMTIKFANGTHGEKNHKLLNVKPIPDDTENLVRQSFDKVYDLNIPEEKNAAINFINDFGKNAIVSKIDLNNCVLNSQSLNKVEKIPEAFYSAYIQSSQISILPQNTDVVEKMHIGHSAPLNKNIKESEANKLYVWTQNKHKSLSQNKYLTPKERAQHMEVDDKMNFFQQIKKYFPPTDID